MKRPFGDGRGGRGFLTANHVARATLHPHRLDLLSSFQKNEAEVQLPAADAEAAVMNGVRGRSCRPNGPDAKPEGGRGGAYSR